MVRQITLSGELGDDNDMQNESDRDSYLQSMAADAGGNAVLVLQRTPVLVRGSVYQCAGLVR